MFINFLVEDASGKKMLEILLSKMLPAESGVAYKIHSYKGIGHIPVKGVTAPKAVKARMLLDNLPKLIGGLGNVARKSGFEMAIVVVCDLDDNDEKTFRKMLYDLRAKIVSAPRTYFCLAIEEGEAWLLGDIAAVVAAYPRCKRDVLNRYKNDSICGTWELMADAVEVGGAAALKRGGYQMIGFAKYRWAETIAPNMRIAANKSSSFHEFVKTVMGIKEIAD